MAAPRTPRSDDTGADNPPQGGGEFLEPVEGQDGYVRIPEAVYRLLTDQSTQISTQNSIIDRLTSNADDLVFAEGIYQVAETLRGVKDTFESFRAVNHPLLDTGQELLFQETRDALKRPLGRNISRPSYWTYSQPGQLVDYSLDEN